MYVERVARSPFACGTSIYERCMYILLVSRVASVSLPCELAGCVLL